MKQTINVVLKDGADYYYVCKVIRKDFNVYCIPPYLGIDLSLHKTYIPPSRMRPVFNDFQKNSSVVIAAGEEGIALNYRIVRVPLRNIKEACCICAVVIPIDEPINDFEKYTRSLTGCYIVDKNHYRIPPVSSLTMIEIGVWAVPSGNQASFKQKRPGVIENSLYKIKGFEPQIWMYACPFI